MNTILECSESEYYADPCDNPSLTQSVAKTLIQRSPYHAWCEHPKLGNMGKESTKKMDRGTIIHSLVLGTPRPDLAILHYDNYRTKAAQTARDQVANDGRMPILLREFEACQREAELAKSRFAKAGVELAGKPEQSYLFDDFTDDGTLVQCRCRLDMVTFVDGQIWIDDIKNCPDAHPDKLARSIYFMGYDIQAAAYIHAMEQVYPDFAGRVKFRFIFVEDSVAAPIVPLTLSGEYLQIGRMRWRRAVNLWSRCLLANVWPAYTQNMVMFPPEFAMNVEMAKEMGDE